MGHIRVGKLPKIRGWKQVIALLDSGDSSSSEVAAATAKAAKDFIKVLQRLYKYYVKSIA